MESVRGVRGRAILGAGMLGGIATASGIALTATSGWLIVRASERPPILLLLTAIVAVRTFGMARPVFRYWERLRSHDVALADLADRRTTAYERLIPLTPARLGRRGRADILTGVVDDLSDVVDAQVRVTVPVLSALIASVLAAIVAAVLSPMAGLVIAAMAAIAAAVFALGWGLETRSQQTLLAARAEVARVTALVAGNAGELQAIGAKDRALSWLATAHADLRRAAGRQSHGRAVAAGLLLLLTGAGTVAMTAASVPGVGTTISTPIAALLVLTSIALGDAISTLPDAMRALARSQASAVRLRAMIDQQPAVRAIGTIPRKTPAEKPFDPPSGKRADTPSGKRADAPSGRPPLISLAELTAAWSGTAPQVGPLVLQVEPGQRLAITGPNGCGKSTLLAVLARQLDPSGGDYRLGDHDVLELDLGTVRQVFAVLDDEPHLFASTLRANLELARPGAADPELVDALDRAGLGQWFADLAQGLETVIGAGGRGVSGGERARLGLARCLVSKRPVLLLDEPVAHLDHTTAEAVLGDLARSTSGQSVVMVSHRPDGLAGFDRVIDLSHS
ncbi:MAG TPA: thiol reductant ABC exporter subunit CydC [Dermatophilaceae bacterium]